MSYRHGSSSSSGRGNASFLNTSRYRPSRSYRDDEKDEEESRYKKDRISARYPSKSGSGSSSHHRDRRGKHDEDEEDDSSSEDEYERERRLRKKEKHKNRSKTEVELMAPDATGRVPPMIPAEAPSPQAAPISSANAPAPVPQMNLEQQVVQQQQQETQPAPQVEEPEQENVVSVSEVVAAANAVDPMATTSKVRGGGADYFVINDILTRQLAITVAPFILQRMKYIFLNKCRGSVDAFVRQMREVPKWNDLVIQQRTKETLDSNPSTIYYFSYSYGARCLLLTNAVRRENDTEFEIPDTKYAAYIFACYIATAKHLVDFPRTMMYCDPNVDYDDFKRGKQERELLAMIREFCSNALQSLVPFKQIVKMQGAPIPKEEEQYHEQGSKPYYSSSGEDDEEDEEEDDDEEQPDPRSKARYNDEEDDEDEDEEEDEDDEDEEDEEDDEDEEDEDEDDEDEDE